MVGVRRHLEEEGVEKGGAAGRVRSTWEEGAVSRGQRRLALNDHDLHGTNTSGSDRALSY